MVFWSKRNENDLPEDLRGKSPAEIAQMLADAKKDKATLTTLEASQTTTSQQLAEIQAKLAEKDQEIEQLRTAQRSAQPQQQPNNPPERANYLTDPETFVQQQTQDTQNLAIVSGIMAAKMYAKQTLNARDVKIFNKYEKEIETVMQGYSPVQKVVPDNWVTALTLVKGRHDLEIRQMESDQTDFFSETPSHGAPPQQQTEAKLTPDEMEVCRVMKWDPKKYLESRKKMRTVQSEGGAVARFTNE